MNTSFGVTGKKQFLSKYLLFRIEAIKMTYVLPGGHRSMWFKCNLKIKLPELTSYNSLQRHTFVIQYYICPICGDNKIQWYFFWQTSSLGKNIRVKLCRFNFRRSLASGYVSLQWKTTNVIFRKKNLQQLSP